MDNTMLIQITDQKVIKLLHELEELHLIKVLKENLPVAKEGLSSKYRGVFSASDAKSFDEHTRKMRDE